MVNNKEAQRLCRVIPANNCGFHSKRNRSKPEKGRFSFKDYIPNRGKYTDLSNFTTRNYSNRATKETARGLIQRYKSCYSQRGVIQKHSGSKGLLARRDAWSGTSQILFLHLLFSLICFATKTIPSLQKPSRGKPLKLPPGEWLQQTAKAFDTAAIISPPGERRPEWISLEKQGRRPWR